MTQVPLYKAIATTLQAKNNCIASNNIKWEEIHSDKLKALVKDYLPYGSGFDAGVKLNEEKSNDNKLVFEFSFHHMNENGFYDGWSDYRLTVEPSFQFDFTLKISGQDRNGIKDYFYDVFGAAFGRICTEEGKKK